MAFGKKFTPQIELPKTEIIKRADNIIQEYALRIQNQIDAINRFLKKSGHTYDEEMNLLHGKLALAQLRITEYESNDRAVHAIWEAQKHEPRTQLRPDAVILGEALRKVVALHPKPESAGPQP